MKRWIEIILSGCVIAVALLTVANAGTFEDAEAAAQRGDFAAAVPIWRSLAIQEPRRAVQPRVSLRDWQGRASGLRAGDVMVSESRRARIRGRGGGD